jgi:hypothetical protein
MTDAALTQGDLPTVAIRDDGQFIVAWREQAGEVVARQFEADGDPVDDTFEISPSSNPATRIDVAVAADGDFVVTWDDDDGGLSGVFARLYNADGTPKGTAFPVNQTTNDQQLAATVDMDAAGNFTVAWRHFLNVDNLYDVYMRRFDENGNALGDEFVVNTTTTNDQADPSVGVSDNGEIVVSWETFEVQDGSGGAIMARQFDAAGDPVADEFIVNTFNTGEQSMPAIAVNGAGHFVVAWQSAGQDASGLGVFAQRYEADFLLAGLEKHASFQIDGAQVRPAVAQSQEGGFVVVWDTPGGENQTDIYGQLFNETGAPRGEVFPASFGHGIRASVAMDDDGDFVVAYDDFDEALSTYDVYVWRFNRAGVSQGFPILVNEHVNSEEHNQVAIDADGDFVVVFDRDDGVSREVWARLFSADGAPKGGEFRVNQENDGLQQFPTVAMSAEGQFVVAWESQDQDGDGFAVYARMYDAAGVAQGDEFLVNTTTDGDQDKPEAGMDGLGNFVITWNNVDGDEIDAQRFNAAGVRLGTEFNVNPRTKGTFSSVAMSRDGRFLVAWTGGRGTNFDAFAVLFGSDGEPLTAEYRVNTTVAGGQQSPAVAVGDQFVTVWEGSGPGDADGIFFQVSNFAEPTKYFVLDAAAKSLFLYDDDVEANNETDLDAGQVTPRGVSTNVAGDRVWVIDQSKVYVYDASGTKLGQWKPRGLVDPRDIAVSGGDVWIVDRGLDQALKFSGEAGRSSGKTAADSTFDLAKQNKEAQGIAVSGKKLWVVNDKAGDARDKVFVYKRTGDFQWAWFLDPANTRPTGITLDPSGDSSDLWVVDAETDRIYQYHGGKSYLGGSLNFAGAEFALAAGNTDPQGIADPPSGDALEDGTDAEVRPARPKEKDTGRPAPDARRPRFDSLQEFFRRLALEILGTRGDDEHDNGPGNDAESTAFALAFAAEADRVPGRKDRPRDARHEVFQEDLWRVGL